jgi:hypothetical protein
MENFEQPKSPWVDSYRTPKELQDALEATVGRKIDWQRGDVAVSESESMSMGVDNSGERFHVYVLSSKDGDNRYIEDLGTIPEARQFIQDAREAANKNNT